MTKTTILEKFKIIFETTMSSKMLIAVIAFIILLAVVALTTNKENAKRTKSIYAFVYAAIIIGLLVMYHDSLGKMFDYMMNNFFIVLYFPNVAVYMAAIIITNIIIWTSVFDQKTPKILRIINVIAYGVIHYLLALVLNIVSTKELDIFSQTSIYGNREVQAIIELSSGIFIIWIIFLMFYKAIRHFQLKDAVTVKQNVVVKKVRALPANIKEVEAPMFAKAQPRKEEIVTKAVDEGLVNQLVEQANLEKDILAQQLHETKFRLQQAEQQLTIQEHEIKSSSEEQAKFYQDKLNFERSISQLYETQQRMIKTEQAKLQQEQANLQQAKNLLQQEKDTLLQEKTTLAKEKEKMSFIATKSTKVDATTTIMQNLDGMLTLEDYKVLATLLKEKQKRKNAEKNKEELQKEEQLKFNQLREAYKSAR